MGNCIKNMASIPVDLKFTYSVNNTEVLNFKTLTTFKLFKVALFYFVHCTKLLLNKYSSYIYC